MDEPPPIDPLSAVPTGAVVAPAPGQRNGWHAARLGIACLTILWALAWTVITLFTLSSDDTGPPGYGGIGVLLASVCLLALWVAIGLAAGIPRIGGVLLACLGVLAWVALPGEFTRWGLAAPAIVLGVAAVMAGVGSRRLTAARARKLG